MLTETIKIEVPPAIAKIYNEAAENEPEKMQTLFETWLLEYAKSDINSLKAVMDEMSRYSESRGMTPEILDSILNEN